MILLPGFGRRCLQNFHVGSQQTHISVDVRGADGVLISPALYCVRSRCGSKAAVTKHSLTHCVEPHLMITTAYCDEDGVEMKSVSTVRAAVCMFPINSPEVVGIFEHAGCSLWTDKFYLHHVYADADD